MEERSMRKVEKAIMGGSVIAIILVCAFVFALTINGTGLVSKPHLYQYSDTASITLSKSDLEYLMRTFGQTTAPNQLGRLHIQLLGAVQTKPDTPLIDDYARILFNLSGNLTSIQQEIPIVRTSLSLGNRSQATALFSKLQLARQQSKALLQSLNSTLTQIGEKYQIDTTTQTTRVNMLASLYESYSDQINQLGSDLNAVVALKGTFLSLNSSTGKTFIGQSIVVYGTLRTENGTMLANRTLTISWQSNRIVSESDLNGYFEANVTFAPGTPAGPTLIRAAYDPVGADKLVYASSTAQMQVVLFYEQSALAVTVAPTTVRPLDSVEVSGRLSGFADHQPLTDRIISVQLDNETIGNTTTDRLGSFYFYFSVPRNISNGTHLVEAAFNAETDLFAPSNSSIPINVEILTTQTQIQIDRSTLLSGMVLTINGTVTYPNSTRQNGTPPPSGNITIYIDTMPYANVTLDSLGAFQSEIQMPFGTSFGSHAILVEYSPDQPWLQSSKALVRVTVVSVPIVIAIFSVIGVGSVLGSYATNKRRRKGAIRSEAIVTPQAALVRPTWNEQFSRSKLTASYEAEPNAPSKVKKAYSLAQSMIESRFGIEPRDSETPSEYLLRVRDVAQPLDSTLGALVELFEMAEYSPYPIVQEQERLAREKLLELRERMVSVADR
jgi:Domain of unknown function (DUF4129)